MVNFALNNIDVVRAINFQPVSLVGRMPTRLREKQRISIPGAIKLIEEQTNGTIRKEHWFSVPYVGGINKFIEALTGEYKYDLSIHFACGAGCYLFLDTDNKIVPLTEFVDAQGLLEHLQKAVNEMEGKSKLARKAIAVRTLLSINKFIDKKKQPKSVNFAKLLMSIFLKHDFATMGKFQMKTLFIGMMHFQDEYTYDIHRVEKCDIHYAMPDQEILPFCTFNVFPEIYRDKVQKQYSIPSTEWEKTHNGWTYPKDKYIRNTKEWEATEPYQRTYGGLMDFFALPVNSGRPVSSFVNQTFGGIEQKVVVSAAKAGAPAQAQVQKSPSHEHVEKVEMHSESHSHEGDSCGCGSGSCGCSDGTGNKAEKAAGESCGCGGESCGCGGHEGHAGCDC
ncbi:MAG: hypothetical protein ACREBW_06155, partial [Candidatus Micrarchaeaceae archaeon]